MAFVPALNHVPTVEFRVLAGILNTKLFCGPEVEEALQAHRSLGRPLIGPLAGCHLLRRTVVNFRHLADDLGRLLHLLLGAPR